MLNPQFEDNFLTYKKLFIENSTQPKLLLTGY